MRVSGPDAADYLHRRLSKSVIPPAPGSALYACLLGGDGRMLSDVRLLACAPDDFLLMAEPCVSETLAPQIDRFVIREELVVEDVSQATGVLALDGPRAAAILGEVAGVPSRIPDDSRCVRLAIAGDDVWCAAMRPIGLPGFQLLCSVSHLAAVRSELLAGLARRGGAGCGPLTRKVLRVEAGIPLFGADMDASTIPLEAGLAHAIDFDKGCFPGQEVVARIHNLGHPARVLVGLRFGPGESATEGGEVFAGERNIGRVTSVVFSPCLGRHHRARHC